MELGGFDTRPERIGALRWLGPMAPKGVRRAARVERVVDEMWRATARRHGRFPGDGFDPDLGASGRPAAMYEHLDRAQSSSPVTAALSAEGHRLAWTGAVPTVGRRAYMSGSFRGRTYQVPVSPPGRSARSGGHGGSSPEVAEAALFVACWDAPDPREPDMTGRMRRGSLHLLDAEGRSMFVVPEVVGSWRVVADVIEAAGVPMRVYAFFCLQHTAEEITNLLFPRGPGCRRV